MIDADKLDRIIHENIEPLCYHFFPFGRRSGQEWKIGNITGATGDSLGIQLTGPKAGCWHDRATGEGGTFPSLLMANDGVSFPEACRQIGDFIGTNLETDFVTGETRKPGAKHFPPTQEEVPPSMSSFNWTTAVRTFDLEQQRHLADERAFSTHILAWLTDRGEIGALLVRGKLCVAFPVNGTNGEVIGAHCRWPEKDARGRHDWFYTPSGLEIRPLVLRDLARAKRALFFESPWDGVALVDRLNLDKLIDTGEIAVICTRGADFGDRLSKITLPRGCALFAFPQNDDAGEGWLNSVVASIAGDVRVVRTPRSFKDINDWTRAGAQKPELMAAIEGAKLRKPKAKAEETIYEEVDLEHFVDEDQEPVPQFPLDAYPDAWRRPVEEMMRHYRVSAILPATCVLVINSAALGRGVMTKSNVRRTYANIYAIVGALSGSGKTPPYDDLMAPLTKIQKASLDQFNAEGKPRIEAELKLLEREIQTLVKHGTNPKKFDFAEDCRHEKLAELLQRKAELEDKIQFTERLWTEDFTSEALGALLANNREQMAVLTDDGGLVIYNLLGRYTDGDVKDDILLCKAKTVSPVPVDRIGRGSVLLHQPCVSMLVLTQPDLLYKLFANERLLVGGFLARCLAVDSRMEIQDETEESLPDPDPAIMAAWNTHIESLIKMFRFSDESYLIPVEPKVRALSREYYNMWAAKARGILSDVASFAVRWCERAWEISLNVHTGLYCTECFAPMSTETFKNAMRISDFFAERQLEVLRRPRIEAQNKHRDRLSEIFKERFHKPVTLRELVHRHGLKREEVLLCVKSRPDIFGMVVVKPPRGSKSTLVFFKSNPPPGMKA
jgi:hypothetical protein